MSPVIPTDPQDALCLGIDTGGTYTDAVLWSQTRGVVASAGRDYLAGMIDASRLHGQEEHAPVTTALQPIQPQTVGVETVTRKSTDLLASGELEVSVNM